MTVPDPSPQPQFDQAKMEAFAAKALDDYAGTYATLMCILGDRLGLFKDLAANGPATSEELAVPMSITERYAREWLAGLVSAGYRAYDPASRRFSLPPEHAPLLAQEAGPMFCSGSYQLLPRRRFRRPLTATPPARPCVCNRRTRARSGQAATGQAPIR